MPKKDRDHGSDAESDVESSKKDRISSSSSKKCSSSHGDSASRSSRKKPSSTSSSSSKDEKSSSANKKHSQTRSDKDLEVSSRVTGLLLSPFRQAMSLLRRIGPFPSLILGMLITWPIAFLMLNHSNTTFVDDDSALWSASASLFTTPSSSLSSLNLPTSAASNSFNPSSKSLFQLRPYSLAPIEEKGSIAIIVSLHDEWNMLSQTLPNWLQTLGDELSEIVIVDWSRRRRHRQLSVRGNEALADSKLRQLLSSDDRIRVVHLYGNGGEAEYLNPVALNLAASLTSAKSLLHLTPDTLINQQQFTDAFPLQSHDDGGAHIFYRGSLEHSIDDAPSSGTASLRKKKMLRTPATDVPEMLRANFRWNFFVSRQAYWQIGGIDERFVGSEPPLNEEFRHFDNQDAPMHQTRASASKISSTSPMPSSPSISSLTSSDEWHVGGNAHGSEILEFFDRLAQHEDTDAPLLAARAPSPDDAIDRHEETEASNKDSEVKPLIERYFPANALMQLESYAFIPASNMGDGSDVEAAPLVMENVFRLCAKTLPVWHEGLAYESRASSARFKVQVSGHESAVFLTRVEKSNPRLMHAFLQQGEASGVNGAFDQPLTPVFPNNKPSSNSHGPDEGAHHLLPTIPFHDLVPPSLQERFLLLSLHQFLFYDLHLTKKILAGLSMERMKRISKILQLLPISSEQQFHSAPSTTSSSNTGSQPDAKLVHEAEGEAPLVSSLPSHTVSEPKLLVLHVYGSATERLLTLESMEFLFRKLKLGHIRPRTASAAVAPSGPVPRQLVLVWPTDPASGCTVSYESLLQSHPFPVLEEYDPLMFQHTLFERFEFDDTSIVSMLRPENFDGNRLSSRTGDDGIAHPFPFNQFALDTEKHVYVRAKGALSIATKDTIQQMQELVEAKKTLKFVQKKIAAIEKKSSPSASDATTLPATSSALSEADKLKLLHLKNDLSAAEGDVARLSQSVHSTHRHAKGSDPTSSLLSHSWHLSHLMPHRQVRKYVTHALLALSGVHLPMLSVESLFLNASYYRNHHAFGSAKTLVEQSGLHEEWSEWEKIMHQIPEKRIVAIHLESVHPAHLPQKPKESQQAAATATSTSSDEFTEEGEVHVSAKPLSPHSFADDVSTSPATPAPATFASSVMELDNLLLRWALGQMDRELRVEPATVFYLTSYDTSSWIIQRLQNVYGDDKLVVNEAQGNRCHSLENVQNKWQLKWQQIHCAQLQLADAMVLRHASLILTNAPEHSGFIHLARRITLRDAQASSSSSSSSGSSLDAGGAAGVVHSHESAAAKLLHQHPKPTVRRMNLQKELENTNAKST